MNAKYAVALILALQVSMSLCESPTPSAELVAKYDAMKATFYSRLLNLFKKMQTELGPMIKGNQDTQTQVTQPLENVQSNPKIQAVMQAGVAAAQEAGPLVDHVRTAFLGGYEAYARPYIGTPLNDFIERMKVYLDIYLPAGDQKEGDAN